MGSLFGKEGLRVIMNGNAKQQRILIVEDAREDRLRFRYILDLSKNF